MDSDDQEQDIIIQIAGNFRQIDVPIPRIEELVKAICRRFKLPKAVISIALVDDSQICKLNKKFLNKNSVTDCLSFDLSENNNTDTDGKFFELVVNGEMAVRQAKSLGHSSLAELALYITHSLLHQLGFDDATAEQAEKMHKTENEILLQQKYDIKVKL